MSRITSVFTAGMKSKTDLFRVNSVVRWSDVWKRWRWYSGSRVRGNPMVLSSDGNSQEWRRDDIGVTLEYTSFCRSIEMRRQRSMRRCKQECNVYPTDAERSWALLAEKDSFCRRHFPLRSNRDRQTSSMSPIEQRELFSSGKIWFSARISSPERLDESETTRRRRHSLSEWRRAFTSQFVQFILSFLNVVGKIALQSMVLRVLLNEFVGVRCSLLVSQPIRVDLWLRFFIGGWKSSSAVTNRGVWWSLTDLLGGWD